VPPRFGARPPLLGHARRVSSVALTANGGRALSGSRDRSLRLWDLGKGAVSVLNVQTSDVNAVVRATVFLPDGRHALSASEDKTLRLWDLESGRAVAVEKASGVVLAVAVSGDGRRAAAGTYDRRVLVYDLA